MSQLPFHPTITNLQALGFTGRGRPIWPAMGAAESDSTEGGRSAGDNAGSASGDTAGGSDNSDKGFPKNTPLEQMTDVQRAAYYKHHNRQAENKLQAFNGFTPQDVNAMWQRLEELEGAQLSADQKAIKDATSKAANDAKAAAVAELLPRVQAAELKAAAATVIKDKEQLASFLAIADPSKFVGEGGVIDEEKVMGHLTALYGGHNSGHQQQRGGGGPAWGQFSGGNGAPPEKPGEAGRAALAKRHGVKTTT